MIDRRIFLAGIGGMSLLSACGPGKPGSVTIAAQGAAGMNPGPDGTDRPLTLQILQLRGPGAFDSADFFALQNPATGLGADFISAEQIALPPGGTASRTLSLDPATTTIAVIAGYRDPAGKVFRLKRAVSARDNANFVLQAGPGGIALNPV